MTNISQFLPVISGKITSARTVWLWSLLFFFVIFPQIALGETYIVTSSENDGPGSLREAIAASNTTTGVQSIGFSVSNSITVYSYLLVTSPVIIEGGGTTLGSSGFNIIMLGTGSDGSVVRNLALVDAKNQFYSGIYVQSSNNSICGCAIGTDWAGNSGRSNYYGISIITDSHSNLIGGNRLAGDGNIISGNTYGINIQGNGNTICGNIIGLNAFQTAALPNDRGIFMYNGISNRFGMPVEGWGNIIAGNSSYGIYMYGTIKEGNSILQNNFIGISALDVPFGNDCGIYLGTNAFVGGSADPLDFQKNVISGNLTQDILVGSDANTITGNYIGTNINGSSVVSSGEYKIRMVFGYKHNLIGVRESDNGNLIAGGTYGAFLNHYDCDYNGIYGNTICSFANQGIYLVDGANNNKTAPVIIFANLSMVWGTASAGDYIEVFKADRGIGYQGGSVQFLGWCTADNHGNWSIPVSGLNEGDYVCSTASDSVNNTSSFSHNYQVLNLVPTSTSTSTPTPTTTSSPTITPTATISPTSTITQTPTPEPFNLVRSLPMSDDLLGITLVDNYAYIANEYQGIVVVDITDPSLATIVGGFLTTGMRSYGVAAKNDTLYVADYTSGIRVLNITDRINPSLVSTIGLGGETQNVFVLDNLLFATTWGVGMSIFNISNPNTPQLLTTYNESGHTDATNVKVMGNYAYYCHQYGVDIIDITDPQNPVRVSQIGYFPLDIDINGDFIYVSYTTSPAFGGMRIYNTADKSNPSYINLFTKYIIPGVHGASISVAYQNDYVFVSIRGFGLYYIDVADPLNIIELSSCGADSNDLEYRDGYLYACEYNPKCLSIFRVVNPIRTPTPTPTITKTYTSSPTISPTSTWSPTATITLTPTYSPTFTVSPTITQTITATLSPTITPSMTISPTCTVSATVTNTQTITMTSSITTTATLSATITPTPTLTPTLTPTQTRGLEEVDLKGKKALSYPNPARERMKFLIHLETAAQIKIIVYNLIGEQIAVIEESLSAGHGQVIEWDCKDVAAGIYFMRVFINGEEVEIIKAAVIK